MTRTTMTAARMPRAGRAADLVVESAPYPRPAVGDVIVQVHAAAFTAGELAWEPNYVDRTGRDRTPAIPARDVSGVVVELGFGTNPSDLRIGDRVFGMIDRYRDGAAAEYVAVEGRDLALVPDGVDHIQAASLPMSGLTAWQALFAHGGLGAGQRVIIHGAGGAVGQLAVQLARNVGAEVIGTGRARDRDAVLRAGATTFLDLTGDPLEPLDGTADLVFDMIGGDTLARSTALIAPGGTLVSIAAPPAVQPPTGRAVYFIVEPNRTQLTELARALAAGELEIPSPVLYPLGEAQKAFSDKENSVPGKFILHTDNAVSNT
ncbi:NADP-dependent oxidoreductase [Nocardia sp. NPDC058058]|uniref:NADP-dependent oxidoreductase n=1 Tax=Nocardia sp. NPDC058058 TaxID=3346317 RepID=UPI0036DDC7CA